MNLKKFSLIFASAFTICIAALHGLAPLWFVQTFFGLPELDAKPARYTQGQPVSTD